MMVFIVRFPSLMAGNLPVRRPHSQCRVSMEPMRRRYWPGSV
jgi:hypothetical protein